MRQDDLLHVVGHEEIVESAALVPLHEGLLGPGRSRASETGQACHEGPWGPCMRACTPVLELSLDEQHDTSGEKPPSPLEMTPR